MDVIGIPRGQKRQSDPVSFCRLVVAGTGFRLGLHFLRPGGLRWRQVSPLREHPIDRRAHDVGSIGPVDDAAWVGELRLCPVPPTRGRELKPHDRAPQVFPFDGLAGLFLAFFAFGVDLPGAGRELRRFLAERKARGRYDFVVKSA